MTHIFEQLEHEAEAAGHGILQAAEHAEHAITSHIPHRATITPSSTTPGGPVNLLADLKADFADVTAKLESLDADAIDKVDAIKANPEAAEVLDVLASVAKAELPAGLISAATSGLAILTKLAGSFRATVAGNAGSADADGDAQSDAEAPAQPLDAEVPADSPQPASGQPVAAGAAT